MIPAIIVHPTTQDRVEHLGQIVDALVDTAVKLPVPYRLTDGFRGPVAHAGTEVDEGLAPSVHRQSRPKGIAEKVEFPVRVISSPNVILTVHDLCLVWM